MENNFIIDGNHKYNVNDIKNVVLVKEEYHTDDIKPYIKVKAGKKIRRFFRKSILFSEDGYKLDGFCNGRYGGWYEKYYTSVKSFVEAIKKHWGEMPDGGYYSHIPIAEYTAGFYLAPTKECIDYSKEKNCLIVKPHVIICFDDECESFSWLGHHIPKRIVKVFNNDLEAETYYNTFK